MGPANSFAQVSTKLVLPDAFDHFIHDWPTGVYDRLPDYLVSGNFVRSSDVVGGNTEFYPHPQTQCAGPSNPGGVFFFLTMSAIAFGITLLKSAPNEPEPKRAEIPAPESPTNPQILRIHLYWRTGCDATNLIVLLSPVGATNQIGRGDVSDGAGQACFNNIPTGNYRLIAIQEGLGGARLQTSQVSLETGQPRLDYPLTMMKSPEAVYNLSAFHLNMADLRPEHLNVLDRLAAKVPIGQLILVLGFADAQGPADFNDRLAGERAVTVQKFLFEKGVPNESLCFSMGNRKPAVHENLRGTPKNRRALCLLVSNYFSPN